MILLKLLHTTFKNKSSAKCESTATEQQKSAVEDSSRRIEARHVHQDRPHGSERVVRNVVDINQYATTPAKKANKKCPASHPTIPSKSHLPTTGIPLRTNRPVLI